ncbi:TPA: hypothetical protein DEO28_03920 [Candidatus Dependentiae bacterium]|nr:MAG: hypothetical protein UR14_C0006G0021 [candidate division TM6 bacterium GW2011_GWE2_31_21]KKP53556.1 MAG: hypothetical protein UR43_C0004G0097 [candidate division TM6 bacterium GW2011_GWF2_33_332]HBS48203.1 hypothetical protein [Candidatus Dependentiae bacterium]HBZ73629.1 hypothetical protein [Candidatus Dependentiae bacterium]
MKKILTIVLATISLVTAVTLSAVDCTLCKMLTSEINKLEISQEDVHQNVCVAIENQKYYEASSYLEKFLSEQQRVELSKIVLPPQLHAQFEKFLREQYASKESALLAFGSFFKNFVSFLTATALGIAILVAAPFIIVSTIILLKLLVAAITVGAIIVTGAVILPAAIIGSLLILSPFLIILG